MLHLLLFSLITSFSCISAMEIEQHITSPLEASEICTRLIVKLYDQPLFTGSNPISNTAKVLSLQDNDSRIVTALHKNIAHKLGKRSDVHHINGCVLYGAQGVCVESGIMHCLYPSDQTFNDSDAGIKLALRTDVFKKTGDEVIADMLSGWKQSTLAENPKILHTRLRSKKSEDEWLLFIKHKKLIQEDLLMRYFAIAADIQDAAMCYYERHTDKVLESIDMLYLWIKKESFKEVVDKLGLRIE